MQTQKDIVLRMLKSEPASPILIEGYDFSYVGNFLKTEIPAKPEEPLVTLGGEALCTMEEIRDLITRLSRKGHTRRFVILEKVHRFRKDTSNALLKLLEEPPFDTHVILTALPYATLPTIRSRCSVVKFLSYMPTREKTEQLSSPLAHQFSELTKLGGEASAAVLESFICQAREEFLKETSQDKAVRKGAVIRAALEMLHKGVYSKISLQNIFIMWKYA